MNNHTERRPDRYLETPLGLLPDQRKIVEDYIRKVALSKNPPFDFREITVDVPAGVGFADTQQRRYYGGGYSDRTVKINDSNRANRGIGEFSYSMLRRDNGGHSATIYFNGVSAVEEGVLLIPHSDSLAYPDGRCTVERRFSRSFNDAARFMNDDTARSIDEIVAPVAPFEVFARLVLSGAVTTVGSRTIKQYLEIIGSSAPNASRRAELDVVRKFEGPLRYVAINLGVFTLLNVGDEIYDYRVRLAADYNAKDGVVENLEVVAGIDSGMTIDEAVSPPQEDVAIVIGEAITRLGY